MIVYFLCIPCVLCVSKVLSKMEESFEFGPGEDLDAEFFCFVELAAGVFTGDEVVGRF